MTHTAALLIQQPNGELHEWPLDTEYMVLGRADTCDLVLNSQLISRRHASITRTPHGYLLEDLGSHNGTLVNGQRISEPYLLHDGDSIVIGGVRRLQFVDSDATSTRPLPPSRGIWLDTASQNVWIDGQCLQPPLSPAQFCLLQLLDAHRDQICTREQIMLAVWPDVSDGISEDAIDGLIKRTRARLSELNRGDRYIKNVRGRGLMIQSAH
jgi:DNA-binding response OmpR family regulator